MFRGVEFALYEGPVDDQLRSLVLEASSLPRLDLFPHWLEVPLHAVHPDREDVDEAQMLGVLGKHGHEHAGDNVAKLEQIRWSFETRRNRSIGRLRECGGCRARSALPPVKIRMLCGLFFAFLAEPLFVIFWHLPTSSQRREIAATLAVISEARWHSATS